MQQQVAEAAGVVDDSSAVVTIVKIIAELAPQGRGAPVERHASLVEDLGFHSLALLELAFAIEDEFGLQPIDETVARNIRTVGDVIDHVQRELQAREPE